ncbi:phage-related integrase [Mycobacteroides abscessus subsp. abscessus]|uniref:tyrosine-type recombinase/integrase n=1 Tax=Mycobacteroides abscessus TaxID=36809 RepID=UPI0009C97B41|nr:site-specific integrase [Mycobacteroides abscessus]SKR40644.1 phage-related integrase [Mycobacteroides abscessus subsp. abscessus]
MLDTAVEEKRIPSNPARGIPLPRRIPVDHVYLTEDQVHELADEVSQYGEIIHLLAHSGLRWGEMAALRPRDVHVDALRIRIDRASSKVNATSKIVEPKNWERRTVAVPEEVMELLVPVIDAQPNRDGLLWSRPSDGRPLMPPTETGWYWKAVGRLRGPDPDEDMSEAEAALYESTRFPRVTAHQLRHTAASLMIADGANIKTIQRQLGHKSATVTLDHYGHLYPDDLDDIAVRMGTRFRATAERRAGKTRGQAPDGDDPGDENGP